MLLAHKGSWSRSLYAIHLMAESAALEAAAAATLHMCWRCPLGVPPIRAAIAAAGKLLFNYGSLAPKPGQR